MAANHDFLIEPSREVYRKYKIVETLEKHNSSGDESTFTFPAPASEVGKVEKPKTGYGVVLNVQLRSKRDEVGSKVWNQLSPHVEEIRTIFKEAWDKEKRSVEIEDIEYVRDTTWSSGSKTIYMNMYPLKKDGTRQAPKKFVIGFKGLKNDSADPHELMTAALISDSKFINVDTINNKLPQKREEELIELSESIATNAKNVNGHKDKEVKAIKGDLVNLAKALSVSNYIVKLLVKEKGYKIDKVYQTGSKWDRQVKAFEGFNAKDLKKQDYIIKAYNSSDLIIEFSKGKIKHFWGLSLKKKGVRTNEPDPTLLNKPVTGTGSFNSSTGKGTRDGYLTYKLGQEGRSLAKEEEKFWSAVYLAKFAKRPKGNRNSWMKELDNSLSGDEKNAALTGGEYRTRNGVISYPKNSYFESIDEAFRKVFSDPDTFKEFLDIAFRINIDSYVNNQEVFHFSLITGSGDINKDGTLNVKEPNEKSSRLMNEVFTELFTMPNGRPPTPKDFIVQTTRGKKQAFESGATAAKLFYTLKIGKGTGTGLPIANLEVRYKGAITNNPQFQVFIHRTFQRYLKHKQRQLGSKHSF